MKIGFTGTQSVGKTTLVNALKELPEFAGYNFRTERSKELMAQGIPLNTDSTLKGQIVFLAERANELLQENIITDRTIIDVMAFTNSTKSITHKESKDFSTLASHLISEYDYIFYISPEGVEMEDNSIRETNIKYRKLIDDNINELILEHRHRIKHFKEITGTTEERILLVKETLFH